MSQENEIEAEKLSKQTSSHREQRLVRRLPRKKSACGFKAKLGRNYVKESDKMSKKWNKRYLVYRCPYCGDAHMTTKIRKSSEYSTEVLHITPPNAERIQPHHNAKNL